VNGLRGSGGGRGGKREAVAQITTWADLPWIATASYGSLARFKDIVRLHPVGETTLLGASGDMADFQQVKRMLENLMYAPSRSSLHPRELIVAIAWS
jgi:hypothetical protein